MGTHSSILAWEISCTAEQGLAQAQNDLGLFYRHGIGVKQDLDLASYWFNKSMAQGNTEARKNLENLPKY